MTLNLLISGLVTGVLLGGLYAMSALGLSLVYGVMGLVNLAQGDLMMLAAYLTFSLTMATHMDPLLALVVVVPAMFVLGWLIQATLLNRLLRNGALEAGLVITLGLSLILETILLQVYSSNGQTFTPGYLSGGFSLLGTRVPATYLLCFGVAVVATTGVYLFLRRTSVGRQIRAASENPAIARLMGIRVDRMYSLTFGLAAALGAIAGVLIGLTFSFTPTTGAVYLLKGFAVVILGGLGSIEGTLFAGLALGGIEGLGAAIFGGGYRDLVTYTIFLIILVAAPTGLLGRRRRA